MAVTETFTIASTITAKDSNPLNSPFIKTISFSFVGTVVEYNNGLQIPITTPTNLTLPVSPANIVYIRNTGSTNVTITWTPNGGTSHIVIDLVPQAFIMMGEATTGQGVTAISVVATTSQSTIEYVLG
jgi:hypothetical protein